MKYSKQRAQTLPPQPTLDAGPCPAMMPGGTLRDRMNATQLRITMDQIHAAANPAEEQVGVLCVHLCALPSWCTAPCRPLRSTGSGGAADERNADFQCRLG